MKLSLKNVVGKRLFWFCDGELYRLTNGEMSAITPDQMSKLTLPIIIVSRKNYKEIVKEYPIVDSKDLAAVIKHDFNARSVKFSSQKSEHNTQVTVWEPDRQAVALLNKTPCIWFPESPLLGQHIEQVELNMYQLNEHQLFLYRMGNRIYSTINSGAFSDPNYFLLSIGAAIDTPVHYRNSQLYVEQITNGLLGLTPELLFAFARAQFLGRHVRQLLHWPSALAGAGVAVVLFLLGNMTYYNALNEYYRDKIQQQQLHQLIKKEKALVQNIQLLEEVQQNQSATSVTFLVWELMAQLMEQKNTILRVNLENSILVLRLEAKSATDSIEFVQSLPFIEKAEFASSVARSRGNQRFNLEVSFKAGAQSE